MKKDGFSEIYDIYFPKLLRFTRTYLISEDESENIVQEIFIYLWEHRDIIETLQNLNAYLFTLAKNRCIVNVKSRIQAPFIPYSRVELFGSQ